MDDAEKKAARDTAATALSDAQTALETAQADQKTATDAKDETAIAETQKKVTEAQAAVTKAQADVTALNAGDDADELLKDGKLRDGTDPKKPISIAFDKFQDLNGKAQLFEQFGPVLAKLKENPALLEKLMAGDDPTKSVEERIKALEQRETAAKQLEVKSVITNAITTFGADFKKHWDSIKPIIAGLEAQGIPYADAVQRAYFAVNPDAAKDGKRLVAIERARDIERNRGSMGAPGGGGGPIVHDGGAEDYSMTDADRDFAQKAGIDPALYQKHAAHIEKFLGL